MANDVLRDANDISYMVNIVNLLLAERRLQATRVRKLYTAYTRVVLTNLINL